MSLPNKSKLFLITSYKSRKHCCSWPNRSEAVHLRRHFHLKRNRVSVPDGSSLPLQNADFQTLVTIGHSKPPTRMERPPKPDVNTAQSFAARKARLRGSAASARHSCVWTQTRIASSIITTLMSVTNNFCICFFQLFCKPIFIILT